MSVINTLHLFDILSCNLKIQVTDSIKQGKSQQSSLQKWCSPYTNNNNLDLHKHMMLPLIHEFHILEQHIEKNVYDPHSF